MQTEGARRLIKETFEKPFDKQQFTAFIKNLLNHIEDASFTYRGNLIFDDFKDRVESLERIGKYTDRDGNKADILIVYLKRATSLDRARTAQRQFVAKYLKGSRGGELKDAALVAFVSPDEEDWRFSFVKMEYKIDPDKRKVVEEFTPAKRYSFLVGKNENSHTAQSQLLPILEDTDQNPTLKEIENRFSVEKVTKEFFEKYRELFIDIKEALDKLVKNDKDIKTDFESKGVETVDFAKKLLGQIVFLYFLQKKGWFGVTRNAAWGTGPKGFLRLLYERKLADYDNFFNDTLEPLFYEALASEREADYYSKFKCKIPFLNGGLFDPIGNYDWVHTDILLPNELFSNKEKTKQGDVGTGILDVFDRYNFTVKEDEPLEKEVAVDPEMLGKVFENLLEVKDRKSKGTYYTPREIVHYMCQESLINYLATELDGSVNHDEIETLVKHGETAVDNDAKVLEKGRETADYSFKLPDSVRNDADLIDRKLADIKVCDPAVGSGAFLVGMMTEIIRTRSVLTKFLNESEDRSAYTLKRHAIQNSLYGVDIDPSAVEIAKLRLWLSMIVDEDDYRRIKPLPNLDYKIMQGNSLLEEYEGIKLIDERFFEKQEDKSAIRERLIQQQNQWQREYLELHSTRKLSAVKKAEIKKRLNEIDKQLVSLDKPNGKEQDSFSIFGKTEVQAKAEKLLKLHEEFFAAYHKREKDKLKEQIDKLTWDLIEATLKNERKLTKLDELKRFQKTNTKPFFLWNLNFAEIFQGKGGFDVVIANPPYGAEIGADDLRRILSRTLITKNSNSAALFIDYGINQFLSPSGTLSFIVPKSLLYSERWFSIVENILGRISSLVDVEKAFEKVKLEQVVFVFGNRIKRDSYRALKFLNSAFINDIEISNSLVSSLKAWICHVTANELKIFNRITQTPYIFMSEMSKTSRGVGLQRYLKSKGHYQVIGGINIFRYGLNGIKGFLPKTQVEGRKKKLLFMQQPKIISQRLIAHIQNPIPRVMIMATYDSRGDILGVDTVENTILTSKEYDYKFILAILNSSLISWYAYRFIFCSAIRTMDFDNYYIGKIPIAQSSPDKQFRIIEIVNKIISLTVSEGYIEDSVKQAKVREYEKQIDQMVYKLYGLTPEEIAVVEGRNV